MDDEELERRLHRAELRANAALGYAFVCIIASLVALIVSLARL